MVMVNIMAAAYLPKQFCLVELRPLAVTQPGLFVPVIRELKEREKDLR